MGGPRSDTDIPLPPAVPRASLLSTEEGPLALPGPVGPGPFLVESESVRVTGPERGGVATVHMLGRDVLTDLGSDLGSAVNLVAQPSGSRRELVGRSGGICEIVLAPPGQPVSIVQWQPTGGPRRRLHVRFTLGGGSANVRYRSGEHAIVLRGDAFPWDVVVLLDPPPAEWIVVEAPGGGITVQVEADAAPGEAVTLVAAAGPTSSDLAVTAVRHSAAHARRCAAAPWQSGCTRTVSGSAGLDDGVAWLTARTERAEAATERSADRLLWWGLGALACGADAAARRAHERLRALEPGGGHCALLAARIALTTGERAPSLAAAALMVGNPGHGGTLGTGLRRAAATALADALHGAAPEGHLAELRRAGTGEPTRPPTDQSRLDADLGPGRLSAGSAAPPTTRTPSLSLPTVSGPVRRGVLPHWLDVAVHSTGAGSYGGVLSDAISPLAALASGEAEAFRRWSHQVAAGLRAGPSGRGTWDVPGSCPAAAGALLCCLFHGVLGYDPDAPTGRLSLSPKLPGHLHAFEMHDLRVGDARVSLRYRRDGEGHTFILTPTAGRVPAMLVFAPQVPGPEVRSVTLDGKAISLDLERTRDRTGLSVQIPLDDRRIIHLAI